MISVNEQLGRIKTVLIGVGRMGRNHLRVLLEDSRFELVAVVEARAAHADQLVKGKAPIYGSLNDVLELDFQAAIVATPTETHYEIGKILLNRGKHVLMEKPLASSESEGRELSRIASEKNVGLFVGHVERMNPVVAKLREVVDGGWIGIPIHFSFTRVGGYPDNVQDGNNVLLDLAVHDLDVLGTFARDLEVCGAVCHSSWKEGVLDTAEILLTTSQGFSASIHVNWVTPTKIRSVRATGTKGVCFLDYMLQTCSLHGGNLLTKRDEPGIDFDSLVSAYRNSDRIDFGVIKAEPLKLQLEHFFLALTGRPHRLCGAEAAINAVRLAENAMRTATKTMHKV